MNLTRIIRNGKPVTLLVENGKPVESWRMGQEKKADFWLEWEKKLAAKWSTATWWNN